MPAGTRRWSLCEPPKLRSDSIRLGAQAFGRPRLVPPLRRRANRTPSPPPFSSRKVSPASSKALRISASVRGYGCRRPSSKSVTVLIATSAATARSPWVQPNSPRPARHCSGVKTGSLIRLLLYDNLTYFKLTCPAVGASLRPLDDPELCGTYDPLDPRTWHPPAPTAANSGAVPKHGRGDLDRHHRRPDPPR